MDPDLVTFVWVSLHYEKSFIPSLEPIMGSTGFYATIPFPTDGLGKDGLETTVFLEYAVK